MRYARWTVVMADEIFLESFAGWRNRLPHALHIRRGKRLEGARDLDVVFKHRDLRHPNDSRRNGQAHGIAQQGINVTFAIGIAKQKLLPRHLHGNDAEIFFAGCGQGQGLKPPVARSVEGHLHAIEIVVLDRARHYLAIGMAGHADEPGQLLFAGLKQTLHRAAGTLDLCEVLALAKAMDVHEVDLVDFESFQAVFEAAKESVTSAVGNLGGQPDLFAPLGHDLAHTRLAFPVAVRVSGVEVGDAQVKGVVQRRQGLLLVFIHQEAAAAAKCQDRNVCAGAAQNARRQRARRGLGLAPLGELRQQRQAQAGGSAQAELFQEFAAGEVIVHRITSGSVALLYSGSSPNVCLPTGRGFKNRLVKTMLGGERFWRGAGVRILSGTAVAGSTDSPPANVELASYQNSKKHSCAL